MNLFNFFRHSFPSTLKAIAAGIIVLCSTEGVSAQILVGKESIHWMKFEDAVAQSKIDKKPIVIDVFTEWCGYCKRMDATTFKDSSVIAYINQNFHAVKFDAETTDRMTYRDSVYTNSHFVAGQKATPHDLALKLLNNKAVYPTLVFLVDDIGMIAPVAGMQTKETIQPLLFYFGQQVYTIQNPWEVFMKGYNAPKFTK